MSEKILNAYTPPENFREVDKLPPVVEDASDEKTELWLIRIPTNEIGPADLRERSLKLNVEAADGVIGDFSNEQGQDYNIFKYTSPEMIQPFAVIPNSEKPFVVRKIKHQVAFVKSRNVAVKSPRQEGSPKPDGGARANESKSPNKGQRIQSDVEEPSSKSPKKRHKSETSRKH